MGEWRVRVRGLWLVAVWWGLGLRACVSECVCLCAFAMRGSVSVSLSVRVQSNRVRELIN